MKFFGFQELWSGYQECGGSLAEGLAFENIMLYVLISSEKLHKEISFVVFGQVERSFFAQGHINLISIFFLSVTSLCVSFIPVNNSQHLLLRFFWILDKGYDGFAIDNIANFRPRNLFRRV